MSALAALSLGLAGCADDDDLPPLTDATWLSCPAPGDLPFRLASRGFASETNTTIAEMRPRNKDEASDTLGNPGGAIANTYLADTALPAAGPLAFAGLKARTQTGNGLYSTPLAGEDVSLWSYEDDAWTQRDRGVTDENGMYTLAPGDVANGHVVFSMLEADGSCAEHYSYLYPPGTKIVVSDIDGTLTANDNELLMQTPDATYVQKTKGEAVALTQAWAAKGYPVIYLTARPHVYRVETRVWLRDLAFAAGPVITATDLSDASAYKTRWLQRMITTFGWVPVAAYGNAGRDISAYANAGIAKDRTFIIGELAGTEGTIAIPDDDYAAHIASFVAGQPAAN